MTGNIIFLVKFNGALLRPPIPRPLTKNTGIQALTKNTGMQELTKNTTMKAKYIDDITLAVSINLRKSLIKDPESRPKPLNFHERFQLIIKPEENVLQAELDRLLFFTDQNYLKINLVKSSTLLFNNSTTLDFPPEFGLGQSQYLQEKTSTKLLGVIVNNKANFGDNTEEMVRRGTKKLWLLRRMRQLGLDSTTVLKYWTSEGRPLLENACALWTGSLTVIQSRSLEAVQRSAMAIAYSDLNLSYAVALARAGLPRLDFRREQLARTWGERAAKQHGQTFFTPNPMKTRGAQRFLEPHCRTTRRRKSAIPYITRLLNKKSS